MAATVGDFVAFIRQIAHQREIPLPLEGIVVPGSWDPVAGTIHAYIGHTGALPVAGEAMDASDDDSIVVTNPVPVVGNHLFERGGPIGGERCVLFPYENGSSYLAMMIPNEDDGLNVPAGEKHIYLRSNDVALALACFLKVQSDATRIGHQQKVVVNAPVIGLGIEDAADAQALVRKEDLQQAVNDVIARTQDAMRQGFQQCQPGAGVVAPTIQRVTAQASQTSFSK